MNRSTAQLLVILLLIVVLKFIFVLQVTAPSMFSDDYVYTKSALSFYEARTLSVHGAPLHVYPPAYPLYLSITYVFQNMRSVFFFMKLLNVLSTSLILFPAFLLAKEFMNKNLAVAIAGIIAILPCNFVFPAYIMAENLFYPLFLLAVYLIYKSQKEENLVWSALAGLGVGVTYLTRDIGIVLMLALLPFTVYWLARKNYAMLCKLLVLGAAAFAVVLPWLIRNSLLFGFSLRGILGAHAGDILRVGTGTYALNSFFMWLVLYAGYITLAVGVVFAITSLLALTSHERKSSFFVWYAAAVILIAIAIAANHNVTVFRYATFFTWLRGRPLGRYLDMVLPLVILMGIIGLKSRTLCCKYYCWLSAAFVPLVAISTHIVFFPLFPGNNISLTLFGALKVIIDRVLGLPQLSYIALVGFSIIFLLILLFFSALCRQSKLDARHVVPIIAIFFVISSALGCAAAVHNAREWYASDLVQTGLWINDNLGGDGVFLIDQNYCGKIIKGNQTVLCEKSLRDSSFASVLGFWVNNELRVGDVSNMEGVDYVLSFDELNLDVAKETPTGLRIYLAKR